VGETETEALEHIKENIVSLYYELIEDENNLGPFPKRWLKVDYREIRGKLYLGVLSISPFISLIQLNHFPQIPGSLFNRGL
jgi:hypothetical protein